MTSKTSPKLFKRANSSESEVAQHMIADQIFRRSSEPSNERPVHCGDSLVMGQDQAGRRGTLDERQHAGAIGGEGPRLGEALDVAQAMDAQRRGEVPARFDPSDDVGYQAIEPRASPIGAGLERFPERWLEAERIALALELENPLLGDRRGASGGRRLIARRRVARFFRHIPPAKVNAGLHPQSHNTVYRLAGR